MGLKLSGVRSPDWIGLIDQDDRRRRTPFGNPPCSIWGLARRPKGPRRRDERQILARPPTASRRRADTRRDPARV